MRASSQGCGCRFQSVHCWLFVLLLVVRCGLGYVLLISSLSCARTRASGCRCGSRSRGRWNDCCRDVVLLVAFRVAFLAFVFLIFFFDFNQNSTSGSVGVARIGGCASDLCCVQDCLAGEGLEVCAFDEKILSAANFEKRGELALSGVKVMNVAVIVQFFAAEVGVVG